MVRNKTQNLKDAAHERKLARSAAAKSKKMLAKYDREDKAINRKKDAEFKKLMKSLKKYNV